MHWFFTWAHKRLIKFGKLFLKFVCIKQKNSILSFYNSAKNQNPTITNIIHNAHMDILQNLAVDLDNEGRYLFLNAIANQLRYPNIHTHYFSCALLYLFDEANSEAIQVSHTYTKKKSSRLINFNCLLFLSSYLGANYASSLGAIDCKSTTSMGIIDYIHRVD